MSNEKKSEKNIDDELSKIREEMSELKKMLKSKKVEEERDEFHVRGEPNFKINFDSEFEIDDTINNYLGSVFEGVAGNLRRSIEQMSRGFSANINHVAKHAAREVRSDLKEAERELRNFGKTHKRAKSRKVKYKPLTQVELEKFYNLAPNLMSALSDSRRLQVLKELEAGPKYQGDLSEVTGLKGGTFKHHMDSLMEANYVYQEQTRGRYLITQLGVEALKLSEMLFRRHTAIKSRTEPENDLAEEEKEPIDIEKETTDQEKEEETLEIDQEEMEE